MLDYNNTKIRIRNQNHLMKVLKILENDGYEFSLGRKKAIILEKAEALYVYNKYDIGWNASDWSEKGKINVWNGSRFKEIFLEDKKINRRLIITTKEINL